MHEIVYRIKSFIKYVYCIYCPFVILEGSVVPKTIKNFQELLTKEEQKLAHSKLKCDILRNQCKLYTNYEQLTRQIEDEEFKIWRNQLLVLQIKARLNSIQAINGKYIEAVEAPPMFCDCIQQHPHPPFHIPH